MAPAAFPTAPDAGRGRHHRQPGLPDPAGQPRHRAAGPVHEARWRPVPGAPSSRWTGPRSAPGGARAGPAAWGRAISGPCPATAAKFLGDYSGTLVTDGHRAYDADVAARGGSVTHQTCRVHAGRGSGEFKDTHPEMAGAALDLIGAIHGTGREIRDPTPAGRLAVPGTFLRTPTCRRTRTWAGTRCLL